MKKTSVPALLSALLLASCANVTFHPEAPNAGGPDLSKQTGLKYYTAKPYLLIGPTGNKEFPLKAEIISLPDLEHPTYAIYHPGWGKHTFSLAVASNGNLSSYGQTADSKGPETIAAIGSLMSSAGSMGTGKTAAAAANIAGIPAEPPVVAAFIKKAIDELSNINTSVIRPDENGLVKNNMDKAAELIEQLKKWPQPASPREQPDREESLSRLSESIKNAEIPAPGGVAVAVAINSYYENAKINVDSAIKALKVARPPKPDFRLFEIQMQDGKTTLIPADTHLATEAIRKWWKGDYSE
jgi:hypothetical protein